MKVLEILGEPISNGGQESFVINMMSHMDLSDIQIDLLTPYYCDNDYYQKIVQNLGGKVYSLGLEFAPGKSRHTIKPALKSFLVENKYDVVHIHSGSISVLTFAAQIAKECGTKKVIVHSHCGVEKITIKNIVLRNIAARSLKKNVDVYCACSKIAGEAKFCKKTVKEKLIILKNGIDFDKFKFNENIRKRIREELSIPEDKYVIGHVGRFSYQKNHDFLIDIFNELQKTESNAILLLIGKGENEEAIKEKIDKLHLRDRVHFCGNVNNVNDYMQAMDVFVLPSRFEGLPIVGVEAQGSGLAVITSTNVSSELAISDCVHFIGLEENISKWVDTIMSELHHGRWDNINNLEKNGYNITSTSDLVRDMYRK